MRDNILHGKAEYMVSAFDSLLQVNVDWAVYIPFYVCSLLCH